MTTKVTVDAHAGWPVKVTTVDLDSDGKPTGQHETTVPPHAVQDFYVHSHRELHVKELPTTPAATGG